MYTSSSTPIRGWIWGEKIVRDIVLAQCRRCRLRSAAVTLTSAQNFSTGRFDCLAMSHRKRSCLCCEVCRWHAMAGGIGPTQPPSAPAGRGGTAKIFGNSLRNWVGRWRIAWRETALLPPDDSRWGLQVGPHGGLLSRLGVTEGLRLRPVNDVRFWMQRSDYELPPEVPVEVDQETWDGWRAAARQEASPGTKAVSNTRSMEFTGSQNSTVLRP